MAALEPQYMEILKKALAECFVPFLPPLLDTTKPADQQQASPALRGRVGVGANDAALRCPRFPPAP